MGGEQFVMHPILTDPKNYTGCENRLLVGLDGRPGSVNSTKHEGTKVLKTSAWTNTVCNYIRQKAGEIEDLNALGIGVLQWCKEHIPSFGNELTEEGQILLQDPELWRDRLVARLTFLGECHTSRKRERNTEEGTFLLHNTGVITSTFTEDWLLTEGESRDKLGE